jgi:uncharacterized FlaG/YvyC family protein
MRLILVFLLFFGISNTCFAQFGGEDEVYLKGEYQEAKFNGGGIQKFHEFINHNLDFSKMIKSGKVVFTFTIAETGEIKNLRIVEFPEIGMATEVIRVIKLAPHWEPAKRGGKPISINVRYPIVFSNQKKEASYTPDAAQNAKTETTEDNKTSKETAVEKAPEFSGGLKDFSNYFTKHFNFSSKSIKGKLMINFTIYEDGSINDIEISKNLGDDVANEAMRVMKNCPKWSPGMQNGKPIRAKYAFPIDINIKVDDY